MSNRPVIANPAKLSDIYTNPYTVRNTGSVKVYLGQDSSLTPGTTSFTLNGGEGLQWNGDTQLWACTNPGEASTVEILYTGAGVFTPVTNVNIDGDVQLAPGSSVEVSGVVQVAGSVDITGGTITVGTITGNVSVDGSNVEITQSAAADQRYDLLTNISGNLASSSVTANLLGTPALPHDVQKYGSISTSVTALTGANSLTNSLIVTALWYNLEPQSGTYIPVDTDQIFLNLNGGGNIILPVKGRYVFLSARVTGGSRAFNVSVFGSSLRAERYIAQIPAATQFVNCADAGSYVDPLNPRIVYIKATVTAGTDGIINIPSLEGRARVVYTGPSTASSATRYFLRALEAAVPVRIAISTPDPLTPTNRVYQEDTNIPAASLSLSIALTGFVGTAVCEATIIWED